MKARIFLTIALLLNGCFYAMSKDAIPTGSNISAGSINVTASPELYELTAKLANEYNRINPTQKVNLKKALADQVSGLISSGEIGLVSEGSYKNLKDRANWHMVIGREVFVPVMNAKNPLLNEIYIKGLTIKELAQIIGNPGNIGWGKLVGNTQNVPMHVYATSDEKTQAVLNSLLSSEGSSPAAIPLLSAQEMISAIQKDPNAFGFCNLTQISDLSNQNLLDGLRFVPIDKNGNGKIDYMENIYDNIESFARGVWIGKYPTALSSDIYSVSLAKPEAAPEIAFLKWVLSDGQGFMAGNGYSELVHSERLSQLAKFDQPALYAAVPEGRPRPVLSVVLLILVVAVAAGVVVDLVFRRNRRRVDANREILPATSRAFIEESIDIPQGLYFGKTHMWAFRKKNGTVKVGIDDFLQHVTGVITRVELKSEGEVVRKGELLLSIIRKGKHLNIYSPISGTITQVNRTLETNSSLLNSSPYSDGWVYLVEPANWSLEAQYLMIAEKYKEALKDEFLRLKTFFVSLVADNSTDLAYATMHDGGELIDNPLAELGPNVWDDFQTKFIDTFK
jgi:glycine cleavage system H lipoate-binding protein/ABC-type phosphate transport system substrate-binding protein